MASPPLFPFADDPAAESLDMSGLGPAQPQAPPKNDKSRWIKLALIAPLLAKAGPGAMQGFFQGWNQAEQQKQQNQRQSGLDTERQRQLQATEQYRQQTLTGQQQTRQQQLLKQYSDAINGATTPEEVQAIRQAYLAQAQGIGMRPGPFEALAGTQTPDLLQQRRIKSTWDKLPSESKQEALKNGWSLNVNGQPVPFEQWSSAVGGVVDPATGKPPVIAPKADVPNTPEERMLAALKAGDQTEADLIQQAAERVSGARRKPEDAALADINRQIAKLRLENLQAPKDAGGLPPRIARQVDQLAKGFDTQAVTKRTQTMAEAVSFSEKLDPNTKNPADDQALIYSFAKAMDPDSVVREGEYATVQKYAQSWAEQFGFNAARVFSNTPFLTAQARQNMKDTIRARYTAARGQYDNVRAQYAQRINRMTGGQDGQDYLIDYGAAFPAGEQPTTGVGSWPATTAAPNPFRRR